jgi:hypothetical protein
VAHGGGHPCRRRYSGGAVLAMTQASRRRRCEYVRRDGAENEGVWRSLSSSRPHARGGWRRPWRRRQVERGPTSVSLRLLRSRSCCWCEERARRQRGWPGDVVSVRVRGARRARSGVAWHVVGASGRVSFWPVPCVSLAREGTSVRRRVWRSLLTWWR